MKESREPLLKSFIPFLLQISLSLSYLLHNLMSQELFEEASKCRNMIEETYKTKTRRKKSDDKLYTINLFSRW